MSQRKIRVVHYCNQLGLGGTERTMEIFCKYLDPARFEVFAVARIPRESFVRRARVELGAAFGSRKARGKKQLWKSLTARTSNFVSILGQAKVLLAPTEEKLRQLLIGLEPDVLHVHYSGNPEPPTADEEIMSRVPAVVTTNQFERANTSPAHRHVKKMFFVSRFLLEQKAGWAKNDPRADIFYNPVEVPCATDDLRTELDIPRDAFVLGRVGRADPGIHDPISLRAYQRIETRNTYFLALSAPENMIREARSLGLKNFIPLPASADDVFLSRFYNTLDALAHARRDGETFGCNIAEAMIHGRPVVSHLTPFMNAQVEVIGDTGYVCAQDGWEEYAERLRQLRDDARLRAELSERAKARAMTHFEARALTKRLESIYTALT
jgi:glycosyltransferase involved in cell wall biosynthesis